MTLPERTCAICGKKFVPKHVNNVICSDKNCQREAQRRRCAKYLAANRRILDVRVCEICGREYQPRMSNQRFCSPECSRKGRNMVVYTKPEPEPAPKPRRKKKVLSIDQCMKIAKEHGLSYGQAEARGLFKRSNKDG